MALEGDQTRWVGIRPTDPAHDIPTTTKKLAPAVGDLQAIKDNFFHRMVSTNKNCTGAWTYAGPAVPAGEIWVITTATIRNETSLCDITFRLKYDGSICRVCSWYSVEPDIFNNWNGMCVLKEDDSISYVVELGGAADTLQFAVMGYKIGVY